MARTCARLDFSSNGNTIKRISKSNRRDFAIATGLTLLAALLRFWNLTDLGLTHFDEGSYPMTGRWIATFGREGWIYQSGHAPGLFPTLVGIFFLLVGIQDYIAISVSALAGSLTVGVIYFVGRDWFNTTIGFLAALFLATAEYHLIYSRLALTDATFTLFFWTALACFYYGFQNNDRRWFVAGGVMTGLCWTTKYHGFFLLLIVAIIFGIDAIRKRRANIDSLKNFLRACLTAIIVYFPWFLFVQLSVGYGEIIRGQIEHSIGRENWIVTPPDVIYFYLTHWLSPLLLVFGLIGLIFAITKTGAGKRFLLMAFFFFGMTTLFYASFPRLLLPLIPAICLLSALGIYSLAKLLPKEMLITTIASLVVSISNLADAGKTLALKTDAYRQAAKYLQSASIPVITQMSKNYYFYEHDQSFEMRKQTPATLDSVVSLAAETLVAIDPIIQRLPKALEWLEKNRASMHLERELRIEMYEPIYYQGFDPTKSFEEIQPSLAPFIPGQAKIQIFRIMKPH